MKLCLSDGEPLKCEFGIMTNSGKCQYFLNGMCIHCDGIIDLINNISVVIGDYVKLSKTGTLYEKRDYLEDPLTPVEIDFIIKWTNSLNVHNGYKGGCRKTPFHRICVHRSPTGVYKDHDIGCDKWNNCDYERCKVDLTA